MNIYVYSYLYSCVYIKIIVIYRVLIPLKSKQCHVEDRNGFRHQRPRACVKVKNEMYIKKYVIHDWLVAYIHTHMRILYKIRTAITNTMIYVINSVWSPTQFFIHIYCIGTYVLNIFYIICSMYLYYYITIICTYKSLSVCILYTTDVVLINIYILHWNRKMILFIKLILYNIKAPIPNIWYLYGTFYLLG